MELFKRRLLNRLAYFISYFRLQSVLKKVPEGAVIIDCGANVGDISLLFAKRKVTVFAFEPDPIAFKILKQRTKNIPNITCYKKGVGTANKTSRLFFHKGRSGYNHEAYSVSSSTVSEKNNIDTENSIEIETVDLAAFIESLEGEVALVKMDIEGAEIELLEKLIHQEAYKKVGLLLVETHENKIPGHYEKVRHLKQIIETKNIRNIKLNWI